MTAGRVSGEPAWVLHRRPFRDASLLLDLLTAHHGRVTLIARGALKGRRAGELQVFRPLAVDFVQQRELGTLGASEATAPPLPLKGLALWSGIYLNELVTRLVLADQGEDPGLFPLYGEALAGLAQGRLAASLRRFEYALLARLGYALDLSADAGGQPVNDTARYRWDPVGGLERDPRGVPGAAIRALVSDRGDDAALAATQTLLAQMLKPLLAGLPLRTSTMLRELNSLRRQDAGS